MAQRTTGIEQEIDGIVVRVGQDFRRRAIAAVAGTASRIFKPFFPHQAAMRVALADPHVKATRACVTTSLELTMPDGDIEERPHALGPHRAL